MKYSLGISNFLEEISSLFHSIVFLYFFALFSYSFLISSYYSLELCIQFGISFPFYFAFCFSSQLSVRPPQTTTLPSCMSFSWGWYHSYCRVYCRYVTTLWPPYSIRVMSEDIELDRCGIFKFAALLTTNTKTHNVFRCLNLCLL